MTLFRYSALAPSGDNETGTIEAPTLGAALDLLRQKGLTPFHATAASASTVSRISAAKLLPPTTLKWRAAMARQLAALLGAGVPLDRSLAILASQQQRKEEQRAIAAVASQIASGAALSSALAKTETGFTASETGLVRAGEQSGALAIALAELADLLARRLDLRRKLVSALTYPALLLALAPITLIIIALILLPNLEPVFRNSKSELPLVLHWMQWSSASLSQQPVLWMIVGAVMAVGAIFCCGSPTIRRHWLQLLSQLPVISQARRHIEAARISRSLSSLMKGGAHLQTALLSVAGVTSGEAARQQLIAARDAVATGKKLSNALAKVEVLDGPALQMIGVGEETNTLETMLVFVAESEELKLEQLLDRSMALLTPLLTVALGLLVGGIVMSIMQAILSVTDMAAT